MIHRQDTVREPLQGQDPARRRKRAGLALVCAGLMGFFGVACDDDGGVGPGALRFGWVGEVRITVEAPLRLGAGSLRQTLVWESSGLWNFGEAISYGGVTGGTTSKTVSAFGDAYARFITQVHDTPGLKLFIEGFPSGTTWECGVNRTRITLEIRDDRRQETNHWQQCANGFLSTLAPQGAGPKPEAARLVQAILEARNNTVGSDFLSTFSGSVPFGTIDRGSDTNATLTAPFVIVDRASWEAFWLDHKGSGDPPSVDFSSDMVIVAAVGARDEAGIVLEVRRIVEIDVGTRTHLEERVPGDFCSPVAQTHYPFHIVVSPITPLPIRFADVDVELVPCGSG
jgi:hypothetical protein